MFTENQCLETRRWEIVLVSTSAKNRRICSKTSYGRFDALEQVAEISSKVGLNGYINPSILTSSVRMRSWRKGEKFEERVEY